MTEQEKRFVRIWIPALMCVSFLNWATHVAGFFVFDVRSFHWFDRLPLMRRLAMLGDAGFPAERLAATAQFALINGALLLATLGTGIWIIRLHRQAVESGREISSRFNRNLLLGSITLSAVFLLGYAFSGAGLESEGAGEIDILAKWKAVAAGTAAFLSCYVALAFSQIRFGHSDGSQ